jgi:hypothetical protein
MTSRFGSFLNEDLAPKVAASLRIALSIAGRVNKRWRYIPKETKTTVASREEL